MKRIINPADCCGCTACVSICNHNAIAMQPDALGFLYPVVNKDKCMECGLCEKVCAFHDNYDRSTNLLRPEAFAVRHKDMREVETSRSGAAFIALSDYIIENGGIVYGVGYTDHFRVVHKCAFTKQERNEFKGSKYVQSDLTGIFCQIKVNLEKGVVVMFIGTPCQTAGLHSYIGKKLRDSLFLVDIVCHGVPGPYIWDDYLAYLEKKHGSEICYVNFRDKEMFGWQAHKETYRFVGEEDKISMHSFSYLFNKHIMFRHSCGTCKYANLQRPSDITIGDFWGWEKTDSQINIDDKGVSLVLLNSRKGKNWFDAVKDRMQIIPADLDNCLQPNLQYPTMIHSKRMQFENDYKRKGFVYVFYKYGEDGWRYKVSLFFERLKRLIERLLGLIGR